MIEENSYDALNRLSKTAIKDKELIESEDNAPDQMVEKFNSSTENLYNGEGKRIKKTVTKGEGSEQDVLENNYFYQDGVVSYTTDQNDNKTSHNIIGNEDNIISTQRYEGANGKFYSYNKDSHGSITTIIDDEGAFISGYKYSDFGETDKYGDINFYNEVCYTGGIYDLSTKLYYLNARFYDPANSRFLSMDTYRGKQEEPDTLHLYAYCANNPINFVDPSGHFFWKVVGAAIVGTAAYKIGKAYGLKGWKLAICTAAGAAVGALVGTALTPILKPVLYVFRSNQTIIGATSKIGKWKLMLHKAHHGKRIHVVLQKKKVTKWRKVFEKGFKKK